MAHELPELGYAYDSLEPFIDEQTMKIHHDKHHQGYVNKLNDVLKDYPELMDKPVLNLIREIENVSKEIRQKVKDVGGGHLNHSFFWTIIKKGTSIEEKEIANEINKKFGSFEKFKEEFAQSASTLFGSGWTWLVLNNNELEIINTNNQESPVSKGMIPLITIDVWEHAYYLKYQNKRAEYIQNFFNVINWEEVEKLFLANKK